MIFRIFLYLCVCGIGILKFSPHLVKQSLGDHVFWNLAISNKSVETQFEKIEKLQGKVRQITFPEMREKSFMRDKTP